MGASVGAAARDGGHEVRWVAAGRSTATRERAEAAGLVSCSDLATALDGARVVVSVCPPAAAVEVATAVADHGFTGTFLDANAVAPSTARRVAEVVAVTGARPVDGGIVGPPAHRPGTTRLLLSGEGADEVAALWSGSALEAVVVDGPVGAASATKVAYATWTKGSAALLLAVAAYAEAEGVGGPLRDEWARSQPDLADRLRATAAGVAPKAWRFEGELADGGRAFGDVGLPDGFGAAAAEVYRRLADLRDGAAPGDLDEHLARVLDLVRSSTTDAG